MKDINDMMPKIPGMKWGAVTNFSPTLDNINYLGHMLKHDGKWHSVIKGDQAVHVDGIPIVQKKLESMT
ncbi:MAG: hypothetical protein WA799_08910 [Nitrosotalea sp.]